MVRIFVLLLLGAALAAQPSGQRGRLDPAFEKVPFDRWLNEPDTVHFRGATSVARAELSFHQRLQVRIDISVDGRELEARRGDGELVFLVQITDHDGARYQNHGSIALNKLDENVRAANLEYSQTAFVLPGDYRLAVAILNTGTGEHSTRHMQFRVASPHQNLLQDAWHDLQPVEFIGNEQSPDSFFLPDIQGRLQWAASVHSPARVNVILNVAPPGSSRTQSSDLAVLLPTLKAISQTGSSPLSEHVDVVDLAHRRAVFDQDEVHDLDWLRLKASLGEATAASIDIRSLAEQSHVAQFFVSEVRRLLRASREPCVLVVLTKSVAFESREDLEPVSLEGLPPCRVVYIRYRAPEQFVRPAGREMSGRGRGGRMGGPMTSNRIPQDVVDQLEATLKPLAPKVFDVATPEQMTKALAEIEKALLAPDKPSRQLPSKPGT